MNLRKIADVAKELQTDDLKLKLYNLIKQFVYKYHTHYYPHYRGDIEDLVSDIFVELMTPKSRVKGKEQSLLDKYDPESMPSNYSSEEAYFANVVKTSVLRKLIDMERSDKQEIPFATNYDEDTGEPTLDWLFNKLRNDDEDVATMEFDEDTVFELRDLYDEMPARSKKAFLEYYFENKDDMYPNFKALFEDLIGEDTPNKFKAESAKHTSSKDEYENAAEIKSAVKNLNNTHIEEHKTSKGDTIRVMFNDKEDMSKVDQAELDAKMKEYGFDPYTKRANIWYYLKNKE